MSIIKQDERGLGHVLVVIIVVVVAIVGLAGWRVMKANKQGSSSATKTTTDAVTPTPATESSKADLYIQWSWDGSKYVATPAAPGCDNPVTFTTTPADVSKASSVLYPGQSRGGNYKPHGGLRFDNNPDNNVTVKAMMDGYVASGARYIQDGETQYMFTLVNNCGIAYRYDHLLTLSPAMQAYADMLPEPKPDDSRTTNFTTPRLIQEGAVIATAVGFTKTKNVGFDVGVYDYRQPNAASKNATYAAAHQQFASQAFYAVCWLDMFSPTVSAQLNALPAGDGKMGKTSDYCK